MYVPPPRLVRGEHGGNIHVHAPDVIFFIPLHHPRVVEIGARVEEPQVHVNEGQEHPVLVLTERVKEHVKVVEFHGDVTVDLTGAVPHEFTQNGVHLDFVDVHRTLPVHDDDVAFEFDVRGVQESGLFLAGVPHETRGTDDRRGHLYDFVETHQVLTMKGDARTRGQVDVTLEMLDEPVKVPKHPTLRIDRLGGGVHADRAREGGPRFVHHRAPPFLAGCLLGNHRSGDVQETERHPGDYREIASLVGIIALLHEHVVRVVRPSQILWDWCEVNPRARSHPVLHVVEGSVVVVVNGEDDHGFVRVNIIRDVPLQGFHGLERGRRLAKVKHHRSFSGDLVRGGVDAILVLVVVVVHGREDVLVRLVLRPYHPIGVVPKADEVEPVAVDDRVHGRITSTSCGGISPGFQLYM